MLLVTGWGGLALPTECDGPDVLAVRSAPFDRVLPGAALAVHHGGAGTSHAVARAGVPAVVVPVTADQPFWAAQLHRRGGRRPDPAAPAVDRRPRAGDARRPVPSRAGGRGGRAHATGAGRAAGGRRARVL
ncbi:nucleotide disphospho-sugar-binding domain-containing protein [Clavibacter zhangzhiyongii]|uniref:nucleotide disphospho-sugar-binding domain-containing protein n=1 Tax=Clavibacter zhangzhiyongii TaxID=2768071 RepID=UPI0039E1C17E